jgi:hypothetical protein
MLYNYVFIYKHMCLYPYNLTEQVIYHIKNVKLCLLFNDAVSTKTM